MHKFPLPVYLNYKTVIDLSAVMDDGFSNFVEVRSKYTGREDSGANPSGNLGISSNAFSIVDIGVTREPDSVSQEGVQEDLRRKVQTNTSLFSKLRDGLVEEGVVATSCSKAKVGEFIEIRGRLSKPPLFETMDAMIKAIEIGNNFQQAGVSKDNQDRFESPIPNEIKTIKTILDSSNSVDLIFSTVNNRKNIVSLDKEVLGSKTVDDILVGDYIIFAKIVSKINRNASWSSLQKTDLNIFADATVDQLFESFNQTGMDEAKKMINLPSKIEINVQGPLLLLHPVAIFS